MKLVEMHIERRQEEFSLHPFFSLLGRDFDLSEMRSFAPDLTFWVMTFQDILRLNARMTTDVELRKIVRHHWAEDAGHERWFLEDLAMLQASEPDVTGLFGKKHRPTRDATYALVSEVFRAQDDRLRVVLIMTLESAGHIFFERVADHVSTLDAAALKYFSHSHLEVERNHEVFEREMAAKIAAMEFPPKLRRQAIDLVDRCYLAFGSMFDAFCPAELRTGAQLFGPLPAPQETWARDQS
jgi:hypothetical protein